jgi:hypothetical protein
VYDSPWLIFLFSYAFLESKTMFFKRNGLALQKKRVDGKNKAGEMGLGLGFSIMEQQQRSQAKQHCIHDRN